ncbi:glycerophosphodiester phosphodiesterase family protein [Spirosoma sp. SC4-14]|uniref:glycerophosphodiester phosphodiesterase family protein n=1 Tax=Spirosoma sp. SC4-14 TaxID=3128900 RepID=UPI0030CD9162
MKIAFLLWSMALLSMPVFAQSINRFHDSKTLDIFLQYRPNRKQPLILAHRGGPGAEDTENSIETFTKTANALPNAILEMDVRTTHDGQFVMLHDPTLDRESDAKGAVSEWTLADLKKVRLKTLDGQQTDQHLPTFGEVLAWNQNRYVLSLDVKPGTDPALAMKEVEKYKAQHSVFVICYSLAEAQRMRNLYPALWLAVGVNSEADLDRFERDALPKSRLIALTPQKLQSVSFYERLHKLGIPCAIGTYGTGQLDEQPISEAASGYRERFRQGGDILTTDRPQEVANLFQ